MTNDSPTKYNFIVDEEDEDIRLDNFLSNLFSDISRTKIQELIKAGKATVDNATKKPAYKLRTNEKVEFEYDEDKIEIIEPQNIPLEIVYEDDNMLVVNKPSGMLTHPTSTEQSNTLVNALLYKYGENLSDINGYLRRGILHRLDRNTSGLLMVAKNNKTHEILAQQIKEKTAEKKYLAIAKGSFKDTSGTINLPIGRHPSQPKMAVIKGARESVTEYKVLKKFKDCTLLELNLITGRTHQIRVHLSHLKHPILNDTLYGAGQYKVKTNEQVLQSYKLKFTKPFTNDIIELEIEHDEKIKKILKYLEHQG